MEPTLPDCSPDISEVVDPESVSSAAPRKEDEEDEDGQSGDTPVSLREFSLPSSSSSNHNFNATLRDLRRSNLSISNRLRSIAADAAFVCGGGEDAAEGAVGGGRPLVANERCGSWYVPPWRKAGSAYFKSTDGHAGQWRFSGRRLNLHLLALAGRRDGLVLVDSTRRGKRMPDALSKTVPIWCCVLNSALFPLPGDRCHDVHVPPNVVSDSERAQIQARIPDHVAAFRALGLDIPALRAALKKPLRPLWVTQESPLEGPLARGGGGEADGDGDGDGDGVAGEPPVIFEDYHPIICCTSSRRVIAGAEMSEGGYIQGAGDDTEHWALGLTPPIFWAHADMLLSTPEPELPGLVRRLVAAAAAQAVPTSTSTAPAPTELAPGLFVSALPAPTSDPTSTAAPTCTVALRAGAPADPGTWRKGALAMEVGVGRQPKIASRDLRAALPRICAFVGEYLERTIATTSSRPATTAEAELREGGEEEEESPPVRILVACESGRDISVGVALALLCQFWEARDKCGRGGGPLLPRPRRELRDVDVNKAVIKARLGGIMAKFPEANPSRATLQSVNSYLMG